ncbi:hypothetical protein [Pelagibacterium sp. H642]|uniref:hypothetical protein n=1 Tax=Pelagibacterium sp. H642 TaxID=1881069 RepID=UPI002815525D|nr:hypothetical protein [Pelagibacterium sp. H642]WMT92709.1 hypothetical protein NO934_20460 [Pelagibacterium sp. H642]
MFAYQAGEPLDASKRKTKLRNSARARWAFLTPLDLTMIASEAQLAAMVRVRSSISATQSETDVHEWLEHQNQRSPSPASKEAALKPKMDLVPRRYDERTPQILAVGPCFFDGSVPIY